MKAEINNNIRAFADYFKLAQSEHEDTIVIALNEDGIPYVQDKKSKGRLGKRTVTKVKTHFLGCLESLKGQMKSGKGKFTKALGAFKAKLEKKSEVTVGVIREGVNIAKTIELESIMKGGVERTPFPGVVAVRTLFESSDSKTDVIAFLREDTALPEEQRGRVFTQGILESMRGLSVDEIRERAGNFINGIGMAMHQFIEKQDSKNLTRFTDGILRGLSSMKVGLESGSEKAATKAAALATIAMAGLRFLFYLSSQQKGIGEEARAAARTALKSQQFESLTIEAFIRPAMVDALKSLQNGNVYGNERTVDSKQYVYKIADFNMEAVAKEKGFNGVIEDALSKVRFEEALLINTGEETPDPAKVAQDYLSTGNGYSRVRKAFKQLIADTKGGERFKTFEARGASGRVDEMTLYVRDISDRAGEAFEKMKMSARELSKPAEAYLRSKLGLGEVDED